MKNNKDVLKALSINCYMEKFVQFNHEYSLDKQIPAEVHEANHALMLELIQQQQNILHCVSECRIARPSNDKFISVMPVDVVHGIRFGNDRNKH